MAQLKLYKPHDDSPGVYLWQYVPSLPLGIVFTIGFLLITTVILIRMLRSRTWFSLPIFIGGIRTRRPQSNTLAKARQ